MKQHNTSGISSLIVQIVTLACILLLVHRVYVQNKIIEEQKSLIKEMRDNNKEQRDFYLEMTRQILSEPLPTDTIVIYRLINSPNTNE